MTWRLALTPEDIQGVLLGKLRLPNRPQSAGAARRLVRDIACVWDVPQAIEDVELMVSELVANATRHTTATQGSTLHLLVIRERQRLRIEVQDPSHELPRLVHAGFDDESGRGLFLVQTLADDFGVYPTTFGKSVWFAVLAWPTAPRRQRQSSA